MTSLLAVVLMAGLGTVTFSAPAMTVPQLLSRLTPVVGESLTASSDLDNEVLFVQVKGMDAARLLDLVADLSWGKWQRTPTGRRLVRVRTRIDRGEAIEAEETGRRIQAAIRAEMNQAKRSLFEDPSGLAAQRLILDTPPAQLGSVRPYSVGHFASEPNPLQASLGPNAGTILRKFAKEQMKAVANIAILQESPNLMSALAEAFIESHPNISSRETAVINIMRPSFMNDYRVRTAFVDESGSQNTVETTDFDLDRIALPAELLDRKLAEDQWRPSTAAWECLGHTITSSAIEPLLIVGEYLGNIGKTLDESVVACVPDSALKDCETLFSQKNSATGAQFLDQIRDQMKFKVDGATVVGEPVFGWSAHAQRVNRRKFATVVDALIEKGFLSGEEIARYCRGESFDGELQACRLGLAAMGYWRPWLWAFQARNTEDRLGPQLWSMIDSATKQRMLARGGIPFGELSENIKQELRWYFYMQSPWNVISYDPSSLDDPTMSLPNGLPENAICTASIDSDLYVAAIEGGRIIDSIRPDFLGSVLGFEERGRETTLGSSAKGDFLPIEQKTLFIDIELPPNFTIRLRCIDVLPDRKFRPGPVSSLPSSLRSEIERGHRRTREELDLMDSFLGGRTPPPR